MARRAGGATSAVRIRPSGVPQLGGARVLGGLDVHDGVHVAPRPRQRARRDARELDVVVAAAHGQHVPGTAHVPAPERRLPDAPFPSPQGNPVRSFGSRKHRDHLLRRRSERVLRRDGWRRRQGGAHASGSGPLRHQRAGLHGLHHGLRPDRPVRRSRQRGPRSVANVIIDTRARMIRCHRRMKSF